MSFTSYSLLNTNVGFEFDMEFNPTRDGYDNYIVDNSYRYNNQTNVPATAAEIQEKEYGVGFCLHLTNFTRIYKKAGGAGTAASGDKYYNVGGTYWSNPGGALLRPYPVIPQNSFVVITFKTTNYTKTVRIPLSTNFYPIRVRLKNNTNITGFSPLSYNTTLNNESTTSSTLAINQLWSEHLFLGTKSYICFENDNTYYSLKDMYQIIKPNVYSTTMNQGRGYNYASTVDYPNTNETTSYQYASSIAHPYSTHTDVFGECNLESVGTIHVSVDIRLGNFDMPTNYTYATQQWEKHAATAYLPEYISPPQSLEANTYSILNPSKKPERYSFMLFNHIHSDCSLQETTGTKAATYRHYFYAASLCIKNVEVLDNMWISCFDATFKREECDKDIRLYKDYTEPQGGFCSNTRDTWYE